MTMAARLSRVLLPIQIAALVLGMLGGIGLGLAMTGLYGVVSYAAQRRRVEIGVRIALGATWQRVMRLILRDAITTVGIGSAIGGLFAVLLIRAIWPLLSGQQNATTPLALGAVFVLTLIVSVAAALRPALRAAAVDPIVALHEN
jgi:ABC-type antimicrobial peptide transport system permease subunit